MTRGESEFFDEFIGEDGGGADFNRPTSSRFDGSEVSNLITTTARFL